jgi:hypothetical protein
MVQACGCGFGHGYGGCCRDGDRACREIARLPIASFVDIIFFAHSIETHIFAEEVKAYVREVFLQERHLRIWIPHVGGNTKRVIITIR